NRNDSNFLNVSNDLATAAENGEFTNIRVFHELLIDLFYNVTRSLTPLTVQNAGKALQYCQHFIKTLLSSPIYERKTSFCGRPKLASDRNSHVDKALEFLRQAPNHTEAYRFGQIRFTPVREYTTQPNVVDNFRPTTTQVHFVIQRRELFLQLNTAQLLPREVEKPISVPVDNRNTTGNMSTANTTKANSTSAPDGNVDYTHPDDQTTPSHVTPGTHPHVVDNFRPTAPPFHIVIQRRELSLQLNTAQLLPREVAKPISVPVDNGNTTGNMSTANTTKANNASAPDGNVELTDEEIRDLLRANNCTNLKFDEEAGAVVYNKDILNQYQKHKETQTNMELVLMCISTAAVFLALILLTALRLKSSEKLFIHKNLLLSLGLGNLVYIMDKTLFDTREKHTEFLLLSRGWWLLSVRPHLTWGSLRIPIYLVVLSNSPLEMSDADVGSMGVYGFTKDPY
ncbi:hypothetical protein AWC38_SpisGene24437, partial [Stylophora pistillata]